MMAKLSKFGVSLSDYQESMLLPEVVVEGVTEYRTR
jgi:hypothetical protein